MSLHRSLPSDIRAVTVRFFQHGEVSGRFLCGHAYLFGHDIDEAVETNVRDTFGKHARTGWWEELGPGQFWTSVMEDGNAIGEVRASVVEVAEAARAEAA